MTCEASAAASKPLYTCTVRSLSSNSHAMSLSRCASSSSDRTRSTFPSASSSTFSALPSRSTPPANEKNKRLEVRPPANLTSPLVRCSRCSAICARGSSADSLSTHFSSSASRPTSHFLGSCGSCTGADSCSSSWSSLFCPPSPSSSTSSCSPLPCLLSPAPSPGGAPAPLLLPPLFLFPFAFGPSIFLSFVLPLAFGSSIFLSLDCPVLAIPPPPLPVDLPAMAFSAASL